MREALSALGSVSFGFGNVSVTIGGIVVFLISVYLSFWLAKTLRGVLSEDILPNMNLPRGVANSISSLSYYALLIFGLMVALAAAGFHISQLAIVLGALSVGIGLGLQDVVKNFVSGLILMVERPVQPGDIAEVSGTIGKVRDIGMRATTLTTFEGADVIVPNGMLLSEKMINWTLSSDKRRIEISLGVTYGTEPQRVLDLLMQVAEAAKGVARSPSPTVVFSGFGQSTLDFSVRAWTDNYDDAVFVRSALAVDIHSALVKAGISIPYPQRDLHIKSISPEALKPASGV
jgi:small-conductance mechanosensitive channel